jgi:transcription elongation factor Elf1
VFEGPAAFRLELVHGREPCPRCGHAEAAAVALRYTGTVLWVKCPTCGTLDVNVGLAPRRRPPG